MRNSNSFEAVPLRLRTTEQCADDKAPHEPREWSTRANCAGTGWYLEQERGVVRIQHLERFGELAEQNLHCSAQAHEVT
jgi:hypothetical protein